MERAAAAGTAPRRCAAKVARARVPAPPPAGVVRRRRRVERRGPSRRPNHQVRRTFLCPSRRFRRRHRPGSTVESVPLEPPVLFVFFCFAVPKVFCGPVELQLSHRVVPVGPNGNPFRRVFSLLSR